MSERNQFEASFKGTFQRDKKKPDEYWNTPTQCAWKAWQLRAAKASADHAALQAENERLRGLLAAARCPDLECDGHGTTVVGQVCCGQGYSNGYGEMECCGQPDPEPGPCQWCDERAKAVAATEGSDGWRSMESAPTTPIGNNVAAPRVQLWVPPYGPFYGHFSDGRWVVAGLLNKEAQPALWMPPPAPPTDAEGER